MSYKFHKGKNLTDHTILVGAVGNGSASFYVGNYFPVFHDSECPWRVSILYPHSDRWAVLPVKDETSAQKILIAAWTCMEGEYAKPPQRSNHGKIV